MCTYLDLSKILHTQNISSFLQGSKTCVIKYYITVSWYGVMKELVFLKFRKISLRAISSARYDAHTEPLFRNLLKIEDIHKVQQLKFFYKLTHTDLPE